MNTLPTELIEKALGLCGKTMENITIITGYEVINDYWDIEYGPSIEKFCYYLLSPEFIDKYCEIKPTVIGDFGHAIYYYQKGNPDILTNLLSKI